jgi:hypothetical protein
VLENSATLGIVFMCYGGAEQSEHPVAEILGSAAVGVDRVDGAANRPADDQLDFLRVQSLGKRGRPNHIREQGGHDTTFFPQLLPTPA